ncbi:MAG: acyl-CoA/acyl-ACP dehydrogenase [Proteobacteria bacterium]|nr:acyl-CoA/acyl-ACP dehydrogenase [Pseudomonadota bacterium]
MNLEFTPSQSSLRDEVRALLEQRCDSQAARRAEAGEPGYDPELWAEFGRRGWLGLPVPSARGGAGGSCVELALVGEELGRAACPLPWQTGALQAGAALGALGGASERTRLAAALRGELRLSFALAEPDSPVDPAGVRLEAAPSADRWELRGVKRFVGFAHSAEAFLALARSAAGVGLFWVEAGAPGLERVRLDSIAADAPCELRFDGAPAELLGADGGALPEIGTLLDRAAVALCAELAGGARAALDYALDYVRRRQQFGRAIGSFQAIRHRAADMLMQADAARCAAYEAATRLDAGLPAELHVAMAQVTCTHAAQRVTAAAHQMMGGVGFYADRDLQLWYRRARAAAPLLGAEGQRLERVAKALELEAG